ncbi:Fasciclin-like arabinogalactan family protein [Melia azedarach]|uniref:Fasciclin-like arabinogalactan family protein n=1 Tax=Melia azedarach TaxID=155640 RepID=A0ACC1XZM2_MELAZ|nr:Fasciclin-like arabinogalactan family protein [Melia azedarach]
MATNSNSLYSILILILVSFPITATALPTSDLETLLLLLRANGHALFANAISTSDLLFDLLARPSLTLFAPTDPALFALDMTQTPPFYLSTLRLHALPLRLSWPDLLQLPNGSSFPTLLPSRDLRVTRRSPGVVLVGGIQVVMPGMYYGTHLAVHGLGGILSFRSPSNRHNGTSILSIPPVNHSAVAPPLPEIPRIPTNHNNRTDSSPVNHTTFFPPVNHTIFSPLADIPRIPTNCLNRTTDSSPINGDIPTCQTNRTDSSPFNHTVVVLPPVLARAPGPAGLNAYSPAESPKDRDFWISNSTGLTSPTENPPAPAPLRKKLTRSRELGEVFVNGEICTVG